MCENIQHFLTDHAGFVSHGFYHLQDATVNFRTNSYEIEDREDEAGESYCLDIALDIVARNQKSVAEVVTQIKKYFPNLKIFETHPDPLFGPKELRKEDPDLVTRVDQLFSSARKK